MVEEGCNCRWLEDGGGRKLNNESEKLEAGCGRLKER